MTTPNIVPVGYQATSKDFLQCKVARDGRSFLTDVSVSVPSGTTTTTIVGLIPFNRGCTIGVKGSGFFSGALGTSVTASVGVIYDDNVTNTNIPALFTSASTAAAAGGELVVAASAANLSYVTTGNGWIAVTIGGATTGTTGSITAQVLLDYFEGGK